MRTKIKYNPRKLMEMAIEAMRRISASGAPSAASTASGRPVSEPREDGKVSPLVGETKGILEGLVQ